MTTTNADRSNPPKPTALTLVVNGLGHVPSFKNGKMMARGRLITDPKKQKWMKLVAASFVSQLNYEYQTREHVMPTGQSPPCWILSSMPLDDSLEWIGVPCGTWRRVKKGEEGATITIEAL